MSTFRTPAAFAHLESYLALVNLDCGLNWGDLSHLHRWASHDINWAFLRGMVDFWDPEDHVFRIGLDELCPTIEEFSALMRQDMALPLASLRDGRSPRAILAELLEIEESDCRAMIVEGKLHLGRLVNFFTWLGDDPTYFHGRTAACIICAFSQMVLVTGDAVSVDPLIIRVVLEARRGRLVTPILLAETLNGLDAMAQGQIEFFRGSPYLLYMWLTERFRFVQPQLPWDSRAFFTRFDYAIASPLTSFDWTVAFSEMAAMIRWDVPWWRLRSMITSMGGQNFIRIRGLRETSFYIPSRLTRQFNVHLSLPLPLRNFSSVALPITPRLETTLQGLWTTRFTRRFQLGEFGITHVTRADVVLHIWRRVRQNIEHDAMLMRWFRYPDIRVTEETVLASYHALERERMLQSAIQDAD